MMNPLGPVASAFYQDNSEVAAIMGPVGSAKSTAAALRLARHAYEQRPYNGVRHSRWLIVRNTGPQLVDTTIKTWLKLFPEGTYGKYSSTAKTHRWFFKPQGQKEMISAEFIFRALDDERDVANVLGFEGTGAWLNELREIDADQIWAQLGGRLGRYPGADMGGCTWKGRIGDTNPWSATSKFHDMFVAEKRDGYQFFKQPGGLEPDAENLENLEQTAETLLLPWNDERRRVQGRKYYLGLVRDYSAEDKAMMVDCKYGAARDGKAVFTSYEDNTHCQKFELFQWQSHPKEAPVVPIHIGYDNTGRHPAAVIAQITADGQYRVRYDFCGADVGMKEHARKLRQFIAEKIPNAKVERITCDPAGIAKDSGDLDMRMIVAMEFNGVSVINARTNDIPTRIEAVDGLFRRQVKGQPALIIHPDCKILRSACINKYAYRKLKISGGTRFTEVPDKITPYADAADGLQYLALGGGEGRLVSGTGKEVVWPASGKIITPERAQAWNPLGAI